MSEETPAYPADAAAATYLLTVRGQAAPPTAEDARMLHNATAGHPDGVAAARSLGDLSHQAFTGYGEAHTGEVQFIDFWNSLSGLGTFFANPQVQAGAGQLFNSRDTPLWQAADGFAGFHLTIPSGKQITGVGLLRATVSSLDKAAAAFTDYAAVTINRSRRHGIVSHSAWVRVPDPGAEQATEVLGVDMWMDPAEMSSYYDLGLGFDRLGPVFAGAPNTSLWQSAPGDWTEW